MVTRRSTAVWEGNLRDGKGTMSLGSGTYQGAYSFASRFETGPGTNPEELVAAAHAGCFSLQLSALLAGAGYQPKRIATEARVRLEEADGGFAITQIHLTATGVVPGIDEETFREHADSAKEICPVSKALAGVEITLEAMLESA